MTDTEDTIAFAPVAIADLPSKPTRSTDPALIAMGTAILSVVDDTTAARDALTFTDRKDAVNRAAVIKRSVAAAGGAPDGKAIGTRIIADGDAFAVVVVLRAAKPAKGKGGK